MRIRLSLVRFLLEATFLVLVAVAAGLAGLEAVWIGVVMFGAWLLVALVERGGSRRARAKAASTEPEPEPQPEPAGTAARAGAGARAGTRARAGARARARARRRPAAARARTRTRTRAGAGAGARGRPARPARHDPAHLEHLGARAPCRDDGRRRGRRGAGDPARAPAGVRDASGDLPVEFDELVRDAFGADLAGLAG